MKELFQILSNIELNDKSSDELASLLRSHLTPENFDTCYAASDVQTTITAIKWTFQL